MEHENRYSALLFPAHAMYRSWQALLPGFEWLTWKTFLIGAIEAYGYGWYFALIWVPIYTVFAARSVRTVADKQ